MPITKSGKKVLANMIEEYGSEKGKDIFYAKMVKSPSTTSKWHGKGGGTLEKAQKTYATEHKEEMMTAMKKKLKVAKK